MKKYQKPEVEITKFQAEAILLVSGAIPDDGGALDGSDDWD